MLICMRTTLQLDDDLISEAKATAARTKRTLSHVIEDALRQAASTRSTRPQVPVSVPTVPGALRPGIDLNDSAGLLEFMEDAR